MKSGSLWEMWRVDHGGRSGDIAGVFRLVCREDGIEIGILGFG